MKQISEKLGIKLVYNSPDEKPAIPAYYKPNKDGIASINFISDHGKSRIIVEISFSVKKDKNGHRMIDNEYYEIEEKEINELFELTTWEELLDPQPLREALEILKSIKESD